MAATSFTITRRNGEVHTVLVDACDLERVLAAGPWHVKPDRKTVYVQRKALVDGKRKTQKLHRFLFNAGDLEIDHANGNGLDNRRENLRVATNGQNVCNQGIRRSNTAGFKGVSWYKRAGKWRASIGLAGKKRHLGLYDTAEAAHAAYCRAALELHGTFARTG